MGCTKTIIHSFTFEFPYQYREIHILLYYILYTIDSIYFNFIYYWLYLFFVQSLLYVKRVKLLIVRGLYGLSTLSKTKKP